MLTIGVGFVVVRHVMDAALSWDATQKLDHVCSGLAFGGGSLWMGIKDDDSSSPNIIRQYTVND